jgi:hypothetical protein
MFAAQSVFDGYFSYRKTELNNIFRPCNPFINKFYDDLVSKGLNVFLEQKDLSPDAQGTSQAWFKGMRKSKFFITFMSEVTLKPLKNDLVTGFGSGDSNSDELLAEYEQAVNTFDPEHIVIVLMGRLSHYKAPAPETDDEEESDTSCPPSLLRFPKLDALDYPTICSDTCQARTVRTTMRTLFQARTVLRVDPANMQEGIGHLCNLIEGERDADPFGETKKAGEAMEDKVLEMFSKVADEYQRVGRIAQVAEIDGIQGRIEGDRLMAKLDNLMKKKDYDGCVEIICEASKLYQRIVTEPVERSADELTQILQHEDLGRKLQTKTPLMTVREWAVGEANHSMEQARLYYSSQNYSKALFLAEEAKDSFQWAGAAFDVQHALALIAEIEHDISRAESLRRKKEEDDAKKPNADDVNHKFKNYVMYNAGTLRELFHEMDDDRSGVLNAKEFRAVLEKIECPMSTLEFRKLYRRYDPDGDGISYNEFLHSVVF